MIILFFYTDQTTDWVDASATFFGPILAAIIAVVGVMVTIKSNSKLKEKELLDSLDSKSGWRKQLFDIASKTYMTTDDIFRILSSLRYKPKTESERKGSERANFDEASSDIYHALYSIIEKKYSSNIEKGHKVNNKFNTELTFEESEEVRLYTKFLLKHHWEELRYDKNDINEIDGKAWEDIKEEIDYFKNTSNTKLDNKYISMQNYLKKISNSNESLVETKRYHQSHSLVSSLFASLIILLSLIFNRRAKK